MMKQYYMAAKIDPNALPEPSDAVREMEAQGSHITYFSPFGIDPLISRDDLVQRREEMFRAKYHDFAQFFYTAVNGNYLLFKEGLLFLIETSKYLESLLSQ